MTATPARRRDRHPGRPDLLVISSYPRAGRVHDTHTVVGVASYARQTVAALIRERPELAVTVLADVLPGEPSICRDSGVCVRRTWRRDSFRGWPALFSNTLVRFRRTRTVLLELELAMFGGPVFVVPLLLLLAVLRLRGTRTTVVLHHVVTDIRALAGHVGLPPERRLLTALYNVALRVFYRAITRLAGTVIVFEDVHAEWLRRTLGAGNITVIHHGVDAVSDAPSRMAARERLHIPPNDIVVLQFGFLAWYKGSDLLLETNSCTGGSDTSGRPIRLIVAGGASPHRTGKEFYRRYVDHVLHTARKRGITVTGVVDEDDMAAYFAAVDVTVFPYRAFMGASGPLSMALAYRTPFLLSAALGGMLASGDMAAALTMAGLPPGQVLFGRVEDVWGSVREIAGSEPVRAAFAGVCAHVAAARSWTVIGRQYDQVLFPSGRSCATIPPAERVRPAGGDAM